MFDKNKIERKATHLTGKSDSLRLRKKFHFQCLMLSKSVMHWSSMVSRLAPPQIDAKRRVARRMLSNRWLSDVNSLYRYSCRCKRDNSHWQVTAFWSNYDMHRCQHYRFWVGYPAYWAPSRFSGKTFGFFCKFCIDRTYLYQFLCFACLEFKAASTRSLTQPRLKISRVILARAISV